jgi:photosystem II stability/assembly factor-like uncharacterized protein
MDVRPATASLALILAAAVALASEHQAVATPPRTEEATTPAPAATAPARTTAVDDALRDDANLHDICFVGSRDGWCVGDHGAVWRTEDGGKTWKPLSCPVDCALRSVCFLTDRIGWVAGGSTTPFTRVGVGVLLATRDGGQTWKELTRSSRPLPQLHVVRFFTPTSGIVVGESTAEFPTGVMITNDAGKTWQSVDGPPHDGWRAADFLAPTIGVVAGLDGETARVDGARMIDLRAGRFGLRGLYDVKLNRDDSGWMVGDGALVLRTHNRGVVWEAPPTLLPKEARAFFNFRAVAVRGSRVWIAGSPGSIVWHSPDGGRSWRAQPTGQTAPLERLSFSTDKLGCAVGAFGVILRTEDGGQTWEPVRAANRRAALLAVQSRPDRISFSALAKESGDLGYRSVVLLPVLGQGEGEGARDPGLDLKLDDAVTAVGGSQGVTGWQFPLDIPGLDRDPRKLVADWMRRTEGQFQQMFYGHLVCQLRMWRPTVVIVESPAPDDAAGTVLANAIMAAVRQAGDPTAFEEQSRLAALTPWTASRVFVRLPPGNSGDCRIDADELLPRLGCSVLNRAAAASSRLMAAETVAADSESYRLIDVAPGTDVANLPALRDFFTGIVLGPGTDARRPLRSINAESNGEAQRLARRDRNLRAVVRQRVKTATAGAELLGMLHDQTSGTDNASAALQLAMLADVYRQNAQYELAEGALVDLVDRFPDEPATFNAMQWLFQYWTSAELTYQRLRQQEKVQSTRIQLNRSELQAKIDKAVALAQTDPKDRDPSALDGPDPLRFVTTPGRLRLDGSDVYALRSAAQRDSALKIAALIRRKSPALYRTPAIQYPLAALLRQSAMTTLPSEPGTDSEDVQASATDADDPKQGRTSSTRRAASEIAEHAPQKIVVCLSAKERLKADGMLSDACWQEAVEIPLSTSTVALAGNAPHAYVMLAHDSEYLYFAASVPRIPSLPKDGPMKLGRKYDQDLSAYDRISLFFDVDRDGVTWYEIDIDQRGCVAESCCNDPRWNPERLYIAADGDDERWRIEGAIHFSEMVPQSPRAGEGWGLAVIRTAPAVKQEAWIPPASTRPRPESFGLLRFQ